LHIPNSVDPALIFDPVLPGIKYETERKPMRISKSRKSATAGAPKNLVIGIRERTRQES